MILTYRHIGLLVVAYGLVTTCIIAQETVFNGLGGSLKRADKYYSNQSYHDALNLYLEVENKGKAEDGIYLKLARTCYHLNRPEQTVKWYKKYLESNRTLKPEDIFIYSESLISEGDYQSAITWLKKYQQHNPGDRGIIEKIWRLQNIQHLYADSAYYEVNPLSINTESAEFGPAFDQDQLIFVSNRKEIGGISTIDQVTGQPFQLLYITDVHSDSVSGRQVYSKPRVLLKEQRKGLHLGAVSVLRDSIIFTRSVIDRGSGRSILQLYWAQRIDHKWMGEKAFPHNSTHYSLSHPSLSADGHSLYFVSDMPGGLGGNDIYRCTRLDDGWSLPQNMGSPINTSADETAPFIQLDNTLYFASNGHGGLGGLDIYRASLGKDGPTNVENLGYPVNSSYDDFGLVLNKEGTKGFMASNRRSGGFNDDLYELVVDLQRYPLIISGYLRYHDPDWTESTRLDILPSAALTLIDHRRKIAVFETTTDEQGRFYLEIPYSSRFQIKVSSPKVGEPTVSLEIPKNRKQHTDHEIVVVKEKFKDYIELQETGTLDHQVSTTGDKQRKRK